MARQVFIAARLGPDVLRWRQLHKAVMEAIQIASTALGFEIKVTALDSSSTNPIEFIRNSIRQADLIVGDLSEESPNVMWELGFAAALGKPVIPMADNVRSIPFDLRDRIFILYDIQAPMSNLVARLSEDLVRTFREIDSVSAAQQTTPIVNRRRVFVSYSHADDEFLRRILVHLRPLERGGVIDLWSDLKIRAGDLWRDEVRLALRDARIAVLLVSADFLASEFILTNELPPLLVSAEKQGTRIVPIIVKPSRFLRDRRLSRFQALNDPKRPVIKMSETEREELYALLAENVEIELGEGTISYEGVSEGR